MNSNLEIIKDLLILLNTDDLKSLAEIINSILNFKKEKDIENKDIYIFYRMLNNNFNNNYPPLQILKNSKSKLYKKIDTTFNMLNSLITQILVLHNKKTKISILPNKKFNILMYGLYIDIISKWLDDLEIPISLKTVINNSDKFQSLLNKEFPGYIKAGMFVPFVCNKQRMR